MTSTERRASWSERIQPRNWTLPVKLVAVVAVPTVLALALGGLRIADLSTTAATFDRVDRIVAIERATTDLTVRLQDERDQVVQFVAVRNRQDDAPLSAAFDATDAARASAMQAQGDLTVGGGSDQPLLSSGTLGALRQVENQYFRIVQLRRQVRTGANGAGDLVAQYSGVIAPLLVFDNALTRQLSDPQIGGLSQAVGALGEAREQVSADKALVSAVLAQNQLQPDQGDALRSAESRLTSATSVIRSVLSDEQQTRYTGFTGAASTERQQLLQSVLTRGRANLPIAVPLETWNRSSGAVLQQIDEAKDGARAELQSISTTQQDGAANLAGLNTVILMLALLLAATVVWLVARTLIRPLRTLRTTALDVARRRLPDAVARMREGAVPDLTVEPVPVTTGEEIGQVARAFDAVHSQAVRLAAEQATLQANVSSMFTNLSRRSQTLVERQLQLIEQLESNEQDSEQLANLFQLDHLATRMRRNSENLLVLSGTDLAKRSSAPVPLVDVLRAAVSEVEQYQRVVVQSPPPVEIVGRTATDLVHVLSELLDNSTNFSPPDTQVVVSTSQGPDGSVLIAIVDRGVGMSSLEVIEANDRLAGAGPVDVSTSRRMGLFVVGRLAARHGLGVRLGAGETVAGMTASVTVPAQLLATPGAPTAQGVPRAKAGDEPAVADVVPPQRGGSEPDPRPSPSPHSPLSQSPLSALVAGGDGPDLPAAPGAPLNGTHVTPSQLVNGGETHGPAGEPDRLNGLPVRRPGQFLGPARPPEPADRAPLDRPRPPDQPRAEGRPAPDTSRRDAPTSADQQRADQLRADGAPAAAAAPQVPADPRPAPSPGDRATAAGSRPAPESGRSSSDAAAGPARPERPDRDEPGPMRAPSSAPADQAAQLEPTAPAPEDGDSSPATAAIPVSSPEQPSAAAGAPTAAAANAPPASAASAPAPAASAPAAAAAGSSRTPVPPTVPAPSVAATPGQPRFMPPAPAQPHARPAVDATAGENLFAPVVPAVAAPEAMLSRPELSRLDDDQESDVGETTPIFEEIASAWFRSNRLLPVAYDEPTRRPASPSRGHEGGHRNGAERQAEAPRAAGPSPAGPPGGPSSAGPASSGPSPTSPAPSGSSPSGPSPSGPASAGPVANPVPPRTLPPRPPGPRPTPRHTADPPSGWPNEAPPHRPAPSRRPDPVPAVSSAGFATPADEGWRVSASVAEPAGGDGVTAAGLPKRRPRARLVPGAAASASVTTPAPSRSAEDVRGRLSSYQQGVRQGREARMRRETGAGPDNTFDAGDEETR